jgi:hypothetical protein
MTARMQMVATDIQTAANLPMAWQPVAPTDRNLQMAFCCPMIPGKQLNMPKPDVA